MRSPLRTKRLAVWHRFAQGEAAATDTVAAGEETTPAVTDYREVLRRCPEALWIQRDDVLCFVNAAALRLFGATDETALLGAHWHRLVAPEDWIHAANAIQPGEAGIVSAWAPTHLLALDGNTLVADIAATTVELEGRPATMVVLRDARERLRQEQGLRQQRARLEQQLAERTTDLQQAMADARLADRTRDAFLTKVSQELRTPLGGMIGLLEVALGQCHDDRLRDPLQRMSQAGRQLSRVIDDLLDFSQVASGRLEVEEQAFSLRDRLQQVEAATAHKARAKSLVLRFAIDDEVPDMLVGDSRRIGQILFNLVDNGIKFTSAGEVEVHVAVATRGDAELRLAIDVKDSGIGLTAAESASLFQPFAGDPGQRQDGTGLGLALSQRLADAMGGHISVRSRKGEGSCFSLRLRLRLAMPPAATVPSGRPDYGRARVLLVEDDPVCAEIVAEMLQAKGIHPRIAENGHEALTVLNQEGSRSFDLILMDIQMPVLDGYSATRVIRSWQGYAELPIVAMTAHNIGDKALPATAGGVSDLLAKPFDQASLYAMLDKWLPRAGSSPPSRSIAAPDLPATVPPAPVPPTAPTTPMNQDATEGRQPLTTISCLDAAAGLARFAGNIERYRHWLGRFVTTSAAIGPELRAALTAGERNRAAEAAHGFKGGVGTLGFGGLHARAEALERAIRQGHSAVPELRQLERAIDEARREVAAALGLPADSL